MSERVHLGDGAAFYRNVTRLCSLDILCLLFYGTKSEYVSEIERKSSVCAKFTGTLL